MPNRCIPRAFAFAASSSRVRCGACVSSERRRRDDRFSAAFERKSGDPSVFTVAYVVRVVSPGRYVHPQAFVEDMYRPDRFGRTATGTIEVTAAK